MKYNGPIEQLEKVGFKPRTIVNNIATGNIALNRVNDLASLESVVKIENTSRLEKTLDLSVPEIGANIVQTGPPAYRGTGVIVGIIDSGIDFMHQNFRNPDGTSRILAIWDQSLVPVGTESSPTGYTYGVEYDKSDIDAAIIAANPSAVVRHLDDGGHGTHVAGIAVGDGSAAGGILGGTNDPAFTYTGVATEADIIVVRNELETFIADSANTLDAVAYIFAKADDLNKPVVINQSQGQNTGAHDGTSLLEQGIDNLLGGPGKSMVIAAGNEGNRNTHASAVLPNQNPLAVQFNVPNNHGAVVIDIWYNSQDRFNISITTPGGAVTPVIAPTNTVLVGLAPNHSVFVDSTLNDPNNNDNRIYLQIWVPAGLNVQQGNWLFTLTPTTLVNGQFDAWIERIGNTSFNGAQQTNADTLLMPGTAREPITVASYITRGAGVNNISTFSSIGPTRDIRQKPEIAAPGEWIISALAGGAGATQYVLNAGTSMATPHITGVVAMMLQKNRYYTNQQIKDCLTNTARNDAFTGVTPNPTWGFGKVDAVAALNCVANLIVTFKFIDDPITFKFLDDPITFKFSDDRITFKFSDDPITLKFNDDQVTFKFSDDPQTIKFADDPQTIKFADDPQGTLKQIDDVKNPPYDTMPGIDDPRISQIRPDRGPAPFILSTPHHSLAWMQNFPGIDPETLEQSYNQRIDQYKILIKSLEDENQKKELNPAQLDQLNSLKYQYRHLLDEYKRYKSNDDMKKEK